MDNSSQKRRNLFKILKKEKIFYFAANANMFNGPLFRFDTTSAMLMQAENSVSFIPFRAASHSFEQCSGSQPCTHF